MLRERTQRRLFRVLFVVGCVLPTLAVAVYAVNRVTPAYRDGIVAELSARLGCRIECKSLETPRPGVYEIAGVRVIGDATGTELLELSHARVTRQAGAWRLLGGEAQFASAAAAAKLLHLLAETKLSGDFRFERATIGAEAPLKEVAVVVATSTDATRQLNATDSAGRRLQAVVESGVWRVDAESGDRPIPAAWLPGGPLTFEAADRFDFAGSLRVECSHEGRSVRGVAAGRFGINRLDTRQLLAQRGELSGVDLRWTHERIEHFSGRLTLREGQLSRSFVEGAATWLKMTPSEGLKRLYNESGEPLAWFPFTQVACEFELDPEGLVVVARNDRIDGENRSGEVAHAVVEYGGAAMLGEPETPRLSVQSLVQAWFADQEVELPASSEALEMASRLPHATTR